MLTKSKFEDIYRRQQESGLTVKEFCYYEGIAPATFFHWKKKLTQKSNPDFIPRVVKPTPAFHPWRKRLACALKVTLLIFML